jgi:hypothetical protein
VRRSGVDRTTTENASIYPHQEGLRHADEEQTSCLPDLQGVGLVDREVTEEGEQMILQEGQRRVPAHDDVGKPEGGLFTACAAALQFSTYI